MKVSLKETKIPEDYSLFLSENNYLLGPVHVPKVVHTYFDGISRYLSAIKNPSTPKAIIIRAINGNFLAAAKVEYFQNEDDPTNPASGKWDYNWTFYEDDLDDNVLKIEFDSNVNISNYIYQSGISLYGIRFADGNTVPYLTEVFFEYLVKWLDENASATEEANTIEEEGVFTAAASTIDGEVVKAIIPSGEMKVLIKNDSAIQEL